MATTTTTPDPNANRVAPFADLNSAKIQATNDERYKKVKLELSNMKKLYLFSKVEAKNGHSYCDHLKQQSINELATEKLTRN